MSQEVRMPEGTFDLLYACLWKLRTFADGVNCRVTGQPVWDGTDEKVLRIMQEFDRQRDAKRREEKS